MTTFLVGCKPNNPVNSTGSKTSYVIDDSEELPEIPKEGDVDEKPSIGEIVIDKALPEGWGYIAGDTGPVNAEYYTDGGLKLNKPGMGLKSGTFEQAIKKVKLAGKLNKNEQKGTATTLEVLKVDGDKEVLVGSNVFEETGLTTFAFELDLPADTTRIMIMLSANRGYNVNLKTITIS